MMRKWYMSSVLRTGKIRNLNLVQQKLSNWLYFELLAILVLSDRKRYQYGTFKSNQINS